MAEQLWKNIYNYPPLFTELFFQVGRKIFVGLTQLWVTSSIDTSFEY